MVHYLLLTGAGLVAGVLSTVVGLASLVSYPALLLAGLPPVAVGAANAAASVVIVAIGPVRWPAAVALAAGQLVGGWVGPAVVRRVPAGPLRILIAIGGLGLAVKLAWDAGLP